MFRSFFFLILSVFCFAISRVETGLQMAEEPLGREELIRVKVMKLVEGGKKYSEGGISGYREVTAPVVLMNLNPVSPRRAKISTRIPGNHVVGISLEGILEKEKDQFYLKFSTEFFLESSKEKIENASAFRILEGNEGVFPLNMDQSWILWILARGETKSE